MPENNTLTDLVRSILDDEYDKRAEEEEIMHILLQHKVAENTSKVGDDSLTLGAKMADRIAKFAGSWTFILIFISCLILWIIANAFLLTRPFDVYPFILLNLILSCVAAIQAPVIMMSQNRQEEKDRLRSLNDYKTNLKSEILVEDIHSKLDQLLTNQEELLGRLSAVEERLATAEQGESDLT